MRIQILFQVYLSDFMFFASLGTLNNESLLEQQNCKIVHILRQVAKTRVFKRVFKNGTGNFSGKESTS